MVISKTVVGVCRMSATLISRVCFWRPYTIFFSKEKQPIISHTHFIITVK